ncbi:hypothetical protein ACFE04_000705 [Oxalis oulophora]
MAWSAILLPILIIIITIISHQTEAAVGVILPPPHGNSRSAMVLPLYPPNSSSPLPSPLPSSSSRTFSNSRRHLQKRSDPQSSSLPNARMRLFDDLLLNGYYTTRLWIGSPPQKFALIVDTGSTVTYVPCSSCEQCGPHQDPKFQPEESSTYQPVKCNIDCTCDSDREQCVYERQYAEMSTSSGSLGEDLISFGNQSQLTPQRAVFGCENYESGDIYSQHADGIMGLGRGDLSVVDQLVEKGVISNSFSLCYGGMEVGGGAMVLGGISPPSDMVFAYSDPERSPYYNVDMKEMHVGGKKLPLNSRVFDGKHGTVLDSGTTYAYLPEAVFAAFKDAIMNELGGLTVIRGPDPNYKDICFAGATSDVSRLSTIFPAVEMVFGNGQKLLLSPENYLFRHSKVHGAYCLGIFQNGNDPTTLLGGIVVRNTLVMYDRENSKIGFWKTNCSELWERLHITTAPPPVTSSSSHNNSTVESPSMWNHSGTPPSLPPGETEIGHISFEMSLNMNYTYLKPHITEIIEFIARQLEVNTSQVRLSMSDSKQNTSLITCAILPLEPATYISNTTATVSLFLMESELKIISKFTNDQVKLPDAVGSYQLVRWKLEPPQRGSWWQQNYYVLLSVILAVIILGLSASGVWLIWRRRQQNPNAYKPVNVANPEQELQPI